MPPVRALFRLLPLGLFACLTLVAVRAQDPGQVDAAAAAASAHLKPDRIVPYKTVGDTTLTVSIFNPPDHRPDRPVAGIVFFHGGGFNIGAPANFYAQASYLARRGLVAICVEYRIRSRHRTTQREAIQDAFSAMRWVRRHVADLGIDPKRLAVSGGSAGGFLAGAVTTLSGLDEPGEDTSVSPRPDALVLFNSYLDRGPESRGFVEYGGPKLVEDARVQFNFMSTELDRQTVMKGMAKVRDVMRQPALADYIGEELDAYPDVSTDDELKNYTGEVRGTAHHIVGTCRMGTDEQAVLDPRCRVRGVGKLRVVDNSIMPTLVSADTAAPAIMIGERASDFILEHAR